MDIISERDLPSHFPALQTHLHMELILMPFLLDQPVLLDTEPAPLTLPEAHKVLEASDLLSHTLDIMVDSHTLTAQELPDTQEQPPHSLPEAHKVLASKLYNLEVNCNTQENFKMQFVILFLF